MNKDFEIQPSRLDARAEMPVGTGQSHRNGPVKEVEETKISSSAKIRRRSNPARSQSGGGRKLGNYAFIDNQNLNLGIQKMGWKMDWSKFRKFLKDKYNVTHAFMFIGHVPEYEDMYLKLHEVGFLIVLKPTADSVKVQPEEGSEAAQKEKAEEKKPIKGNVDAELVLWGVKEMPNYDKALIVSGDGDFLCLVEYLQQQGKLLHVLTPNWQYSKLLKQYEEYIIRLDLKKDELALKNRTTGRRVRPNKPTKE